MFCLSQEVSHCQMPETASHQPSVPSVADDIISVSVQSEMQPPISPALNLNICHHLLKNPPLHVAPPSTHKLLNSQPQQPPPYTLTPTSQYYCRLQGHLSKILAYHKCPQFIIFPPFICIPTLTTSHISSS